MIQISLEVPDKPGALSHVVRLLADGNVDIKALYLSRTNQQPPAGQVRLIATNPAAARRVLEEGGLKPVEDTVVVVALEDHPGGMAGALAALAQAGINLDYAYGFVSRVEGRALSVLGVPDRERAGTVLKRAGFELVDHGALTSQQADLSEYLGGVWNW
jgi:hypothetical protein